MKSITGGAILCGDKAIEESGLIRMRDYKISDIAKMANVSVATVSRVLNNSASVTEKTRRKVLEAIEKANYTPNAVAKNLRSKKTMALAVQVPDIGVSYFADIVKGIENMASSLNYKIFICDLQNQKEKAYEYMSLLLNRTVDGMILVTPDLTDEEIVSYVDQGYKIGVIGRHIDHREIPCVYTDNVKMGKEVVSHLISQGHERIAFLSGFAHAIDSYTRLEGYMKGLRDAGYPFLPELIENGDFNEDKGYEAFKRLIAKNVHFTAVFAANDEMALGVYKACQELNIKIPEEMAVVGVDNTRITNYIAPKMSTVDQPKYAMGALIAEKLIDQINDNIYRDQRVFKVDSTLIIRESSNYKRK